MQKSSVFYKSLFSIALIGTSIPITTFSMGFFTGNQNVNLNLGNTQQIADAIARGIGNGAGGAVDQFWANNNRNMQAGGQGTQSMDAATNNLNNGVNRIIDNFYARNQDHFAQGGGADRVVQGAMGSLDRGMERFNNDFERNGERLANNFGRNLNRVGDDIGNNLRNVSLEIERGLERTLVYTSAKMAIISVLSLGGMAGAYYGVKALIAEWQRSRTRPTIIMDTSYKTAWERFKGLFTSNKKHQSIDMIFEPKLEKEVNTLLASIKNTNQRIKEGRTNVSYPKILLYGPPGSGKTMLAKKISKESNMPYVIVNAAALTKPGAQEEVDRLINWAKGLKGVIFFFDEADVLMFDRSKMKEDSAEKKAINNLLAYFGDPSADILPIFATNFLGVFDKAMVDRVTDILQIPLPAQAERARVLALYCDKILFDEAQNGKDFVTKAKTLVTPEKIHEMAAATKDLSNRSLNALVNSIKTRADVTTTGLLTAEIVNTAVERYLQKQKEFEAARQQYNAGKPVAA